MPTLIDVSVFEKNKISNSRSDQVPTSGGEIQFQIRSFNIELWFE